MKLEHQHFTSCWASNPINGLIQEVARDRVVELDIYTALKWKKVIIVTYYFDIL